MSEMIERVARAIVLRRGLPPGCWIDWDAFRADARAAIEAMPGWEPIETAPVGTKARDLILVGFMGQFEWVLFTAFPNGAITAAPGYASPTHWMPLPAPPAALKPEVQP